MPKVILHCLDQLGDKMAGPAIRYWEFAKALSIHHQVVLFSPNLSEEITPTLKCLPFSYSEFNKEIQGASYLLAQTFAPYTLLLAKKQGLKIILDAYDPELTGSLELNKHAPLEEQNKLLRKRMDSFRFCLQVADFVLCAQPRQKDYLIGLLAALGKINPGLYSENPNLNHLIGVVPFGLSSLPPKKTGPGPKEKLNLKKEDKLLLWGGGIWNWFDPLTLMHAMSHLASKRKDIHLLFMGIHHPNPHVPKMQMTQNALELAEELHLKDKTVHFHFGWTPYDERQNILLESSAGLSLHFDNLETRFAFRTRILDYLWASLPIICTEGDVFAELVKEHHLGIVVPYQDVKALAEAIETVVDHPETFYNEKLKEKYTWDRVIEPILIFIENNPLSSFSRVKNQANVFKAYFKHHSLSEIGRKIGGKLSP